jgi:predicted secreted hydrolase
MRKTLVHRVCHCWLAQQWNRESPAVLPGPLPKAILTDLVARLPRLHCRASRQWHTACSTLAIVLFAILTRGALAADGFKQAIEPRVFAFPADHGSHAGFQTEWWYVTGNMKNDDGHEFGFQFTIFRRAIDARSAAERGRGSKWAVGDVYLGHLAVSDIGGKSFVFGETVQRGNVGLAGATDAAEKTSPISVTLGNWNFVRFGDDGKDARGWKLEARENGIDLSLTLTETLAPILHGKAGQEGLSLKGPQPGQASYYYSVAGLETAGTLKLNGRSYKIVSGRSWMDHEFGSNQLSEAQAGWDWFAIQLDNKGVLMLYVLRHKDGSIEPASSGTWVAPDGSRTHVDLADLKFTRGRSWTSPTSDGQYTLEWTIDIAKLNLSLTVTAAQDDQEIKPGNNSGVSYYEGATRVKGTLNGAEVKGDGYLEITGAPGQKSSGRGLGGVL